MIADQLETRELFIDIRETSSQLLELIASFSNEEINAIPSLGSWTAASIDDLRSAAKNTNLSEALTVPAFGELTKLELLNLVLYHTQRHVRLIGNILEVIKNQPKAAQPVFQR